MTAAAEKVPRETVSLEEVKLQAERVRDLAGENARQAVKELTSQPLARTVAVLAVTMAVGVSIAYYLGNRSAGRRIARRTARDARQAPLS